MNIKNNLLNEYQEEAATTQQFLELYPEKLHDYRPHQKSMSMHELINHILDITGWPELILETDKLDFASGDFVPNDIYTKDEILKKSAELTEKSEKALSATTNEVLEHQRWKITVGDRILSDWSKYGAIRHALNQLTHHRAQLGVYYRINDVYVPGSYGPSADDKQ